jgi:hypothetical protein
MFLQDVKKTIDPKYPGIGDLIDIKIDHMYNDIKIIGFKHKYIKEEISKIIYDAKIYNFPDFWEDTVEMLTTEQVIVKDIAKTSEEWKH